LTIVDGLILRRLLKEMCSFSCPFDAIGEIAGGGGVILSSVFLRDAGRQFCVSLITSRLSFEYEFKDTSSHDVCGFFWRTSYGLGAPLEFEIILKALVGAGCTCNAEIRGIVLPFLEINKDGVDMELEELSVLKEESSTLNFGVSLSF
jgi:hypothetical protein